MKKYCYLIVVLALILSLNGCVATSPKIKDFFGISMDSVSKAKDFVINSYTEEGAKYEGSTGMDDRIYAWGYLGKSGYFNDAINITVVNKSNRPIAINYLTDKFSLITKSGNIYDLEQEKDPAFWYAQSLNPGVSITFSPLLPAVIRDLKKEDVGLIVCETGSLVDRVTIVLKPLPTKIPENAKIEKESKKTTEIKKVSGRTKFEEAVSMIPEKLSFARRIQLLELDDHSGAVGSYVSNNEFAINLRVWYVGVTEAQKFIELQKKTMKIIQIDKVEAWTTEGIDTAFPDKGMPYQTFAWQQKGWIFVLVVHSHENISSTKRKQLGIDFIKEVIKNRI